MYMNNLLPSETFRGNFCVLRRSGATPPPAPTPLWQINGGKFSCRSIFLRKADKCFGVCIVN